MTAAAGRVTAIKVITHEAVSPAALRPLAISVGPFQNWLLGQNAAGYAVAQAAGVTGLVALGYAEHDQAAGTSNGVAKIVVRQTFASGFVNSTTSLDAILDSDMAVECWAKDNATVGKLSNSAGVNRSLLGVAFGVDPDTLTPVVYHGPVAWLLARAAHSATNESGAWYDIADAAANDAITERAINRKRVHGTVTAIQFIGAAIAADNTDYITVTVSKRDGAGGAAVVLGTYDSRAANQGAVTAFVPAAFSLSVVAGALDLFETDVVTITVVKGASGKVITGAVRVIERIC